MWPTKPKIFTINLYQKKRKKKKVIYSNIKKVLNI